jgi:hypothetical protein
MKAFLSIVSILMVLLGSGWLFLPETMLGSWSVQTDGVGVYVGRRYGGLLFGYAAILWLCRAAGPSAGRAAILGGGAVVTTLVALLSLWGVVTGTIGPGAWGAVVVEALLAGGFLYYFLAERTQAQGKALS